MLFMKHLLLFISNYTKEILRKWKSLPLLLLYPILFLGLIFIIIITIFIPPEDVPIQVGLIDLDQTEETQLVVELLEQSSELNSYIQLQTMTESSAINQMKQNDISSYLTFPKNFTKNLYEGTEVDLKVIGNPEKQMDSLLVKEFIDSITRHIRASQANILTIDYYAQQLEIDKETRNEILLKQFTDFFLYTIDKDRIVQEQSLSNIATLSPKHYFSVGSWFIIYTIWLMSFFTVLYKKNEPVMSKRLTLYGVTDLQRIFARIIVTMFISGIFASLFFYGLQSLLKLNLFMEDYFRFFSIMALYSILYLLLLGIFEVTIASHRIRLFTQVIYTFIVIILSGAIVPTMYFPFGVQSFLQYVFSYEAFYWVQELLLNERTFAQYVPLLSMCGLALFLLIGLSLWKERVK